MHGSTLEIPWQLSCRRRSRRTVGTVARNLKCATRAGPCPQPESHPSRPEARYPTWLERPVALPSQCKHLLLQNLLRTRRITRSIPLRSKRGHEGRSRIANLQTALAILIHRWNSLSSFSDQRGYIAAPDVAARSASPTSPLGREWFSSPPLPSNPLLPLRGGVSPTPSPGPGRGRSRGVGAPKMASPVYL